MTKLRITNIPHLAGVPYKLLRELDFVEYSEDSPTANGRKLKLRKVDLALIPIVDFAANSSFRSLEFGMGCRQRSDSMILYAQDPIEKLNTVHVYSCSKSSLCLLKLLLREKWEVNPSFVHHGQLEMWDYLAPQEGVLCLHELPGMRRKGLPVAVDVATAWYQHTGLPSVFLVWAVREGAVCDEQLIALQAAMHRAAKASKQIAQHFAGQYGVVADASAEFVGDNRRYQLDEFMQRGMREFLLRAKTHGFVKSDDYRVATSHAFAAKIPEAEQIGCSGSGFMAPNR